MTAPELNDPLVDEARRHIVADHRRDDILAAVRARLDEYSVTTEHLTADGVVSELLAIVGAP